MQLLTRAEIKLAGVSFISGWGWKLHAFFFTDFHPIVNHLDKFFKDPGFVVAMNTTKKQSRGPADVTLVFI